VNVRLILFFLFTHFNVYAQWWLLPGGHQGSGANSNVISHDNSQANQEYIDPKLRKLELLIGDGDEIQGVRVNKKARKKKIEFFDKERKLTLDSVVKSGLPLSLLTNCLSCEGRGFAFCANCINGLIECGVCDGKGEKVCSNCRGTGLIRDVITCPSCDGAGKSNCYSCLGKKKRICNNCIGLGLYNCTNCRGTGLKLK